MGDILKIGSLNIPATRWEDALDYFSKIYVFCNETEKELKNENIIYIKFPSYKILNKLLYKVLNRTLQRNKLDWISWTIIFVMRIINYNVLHEVKRRSYDIIHSSYNDFDESALLTALLGLKGKYSRAQKETRLSYSYLEKKCFIDAKKIILNAKENLDLYISKYGNIFDGKEVQIGPDEDVRSKRILQNIVYDKKYSEVDKKIHAVILAGRVLSTSTDKRSGGRLFYIPMIEELLRAGFVVHLHTGAIVEYEGKNPYKELAENNSDFVIEEKLDFLNDTINAYKILSRYDVGVLHAHIVDTEVTEFDKVNIPHRYYEYELAHVVPIEKRGGNILMEKKAEERHALIYDELNDISIEKIQCIEWDKPTFEEYVKEVFQK